MTSRTRRVTSRRRLAVVGMVCSALIATGCVESSGGGNGSAGGPAVPPDATKQQYRQALADMEPVELTVQTIEQKPPDGEPPLGMEAYKRAVEEWSDGKITFNIVYGAASVPYSEGVRGLADGRLDMADTLPSYEPARFPATVMWSQLHHRGTDAVAGMLAQTVSSFETALDTPEIAKEFEREGVHLLIPHNVPDPIGLGCTTDRSTAKATRGALARVSGSGQNPQAEALGMEPVAISATEMFEALQRGTANCTVTTAYAANLAGLMDATPHWVMDTEVGWSQAYTPIGFGLDRWNELPLAAQQLLFDRMDTYLDAQLKATFGRMADAYEAISRAGGEIRGFDDKARRVLGKANKSIRDRADGSEAVAHGGALATAVSDNYERWHSVVADTLGYPSVSYDEFVDWAKKEGADLDLTPLIDRFRAEVLVPHRPGGEG